MFYLLTVLFICNVIFFTQEQTLQSTDVQKQVFSESLEPISGYTFNQYVDNICMNINKKINDDGIISIKLPFSSQIVSSDDKYTPLFSPLITFTLWNGTVSNIATFQRDGEASIQYNNKTLILSSTLKLDLLEFEYDAELKLAGFGPTKHISRTLNGFTTNIVLSIQTSTLAITLDTLEISQPGILSGDDVSSSISDNFANQILYYTESYVKNRVTKDLNTTLKNAVTSTLNKMNSL